MPKLFYTNSSAKEEIGNLETRISALETDGATAAADISRLSEELKTANESVASLTTERDEAIAAFEQSEKTATKATSDLATATAKLATFDTEVETAAQAKFASLGGPPISGASKDEKESATMTRTAFSELAPVAKASYLRDGGKLTD